MINVTRVEQQHPVINSFNIKNILTVTISVALFLLAYVRIYFGVDFADEAFYISQAYTFVLGNKPLIDEYSLAQFAALLIYPLIKIFTVIVSSDTGIMLFTRQVCFLLFSLLAGFVFNTFKKQLTWQFALIVSLVCIIFTPLNIISLSYNLLGILFLTAGLLWAYRSVRDDKDKQRNLFLTGLCLGLSAFSYVTFSFEGGLVFLILWFFHAKRDIQYFVYGVIPVLILLGCILTVLGFRNLINLYDYITLLGQSKNILDKVSDLFTAWYTDLPHKILISLLLLTAFFGKWKNVISLQCGLFFIPILLAFPVYHPLLINGINCQWFLFFSYVSLSAPLFLVMLANKFLAKQLFFIIWIPGFFAGLATGLFSDNSFWNAHLGLFPALIVTMISIVLFARELIEKAALTVHEWSFATRDTLLVIYMTVLMLLMIGYKFSYIYDDAYFPSLNQRIMFGPYAGLYTTQNKKNYMVNIINDIQSLKADYNIHTVLFYPDDAGSYLLTDLKPLTNSMMLIGSNAFPATLNYYHHKKQIPSIVVIQKNILGGYMVGGYREGSPLLFAVDHISVPTDNLILAFLNAKKYTAVINRDGYTIYLNSSLLKDNK